jgi:hypothetical protein
MYLQLTTAVGAITGTLVSLLADGIGNFCNTQLKSNFLTHHFQQVELLLIGFCRSLLVALFTSPLFL